MSSFKEEGDNKESAKILQKNTAAPQKMRTFSDTGLGMTKF